jgi:hypothetical protein
MVAWRGKYSDHKRRVRHYLAGLEDILVRRMITECARSLAPPSNHLPITLRENIALMALLLKTHHTVSQHSRSHEEKVYQGPMSNSAIN